MDNYLTPNQVLDKVRISRVWHLGPHNILRCPRTSKGAPLCVPFRGLSIPDAAPSWRKLVMRSSGEKGTSTSRLPEGMRLFPLPAGFLGHMTRENPSASSGALMPNCCGSRGGARFIRAPPWTLRTSYRSGCSWSTWPPWSHSRPRALPCRHAGVAPQARPCGWSHRRGRGVARLEGRGDGGHRPFRFRGPFKGWARRKSPTRI